MEVLRIGRSQASVTWVCRFCARSDRPIQELAWRKSYLHQKVNLISESPRDAMGSRAAAASSMMDPQERIMQQLAQRVAELEQVGIHAAASARSLPILFSFFYSAQLLRSHQKYRRSPQKTKKTANWKRLLRETKCCKPDAPKMKTCCANKMSRNMS
jgi:hypothetical protein